MKFQKFYAPEDAPSGGGDNTNGSNAPGTTLTYNYGGEEITVDLSNPDAVKLAQDRLSKGHNMEKIAEERNTLKKQKEELQQQVDAWNDRLAAAKTDDAEFESLVKDIETYVGRPLTKAEKEDLGGDSDFDADDPAIKELRQLKKDFSDYKTQQEKFWQEREVQAEAKKLAARLDSMAADSEKYPGFDREKVYETAKAAGTTDFEMVYFWLNRDQLLKAEREKVEAEYKDLETKRKAAHTESDTTPAGIKDTPKRSNRIEDVSRDLVEEVRSGKLSFFTE